MKSDVQILNNLKVAKNTWESLTTFHPTYTVCEFFYTNYLQITKLINSITDLLLPMPKTSKAKKEK